MKTKKRKQNEREYFSWASTEEGGRVYLKEVLAADKSGKRAIYEKIVDKNEVTLSFVQKIFDDNERLIEIHEKYPIDKGHKKL